MQSADGCDWLWWVALGPEESDGLGLLHEVVAEKGLPRAIVVVAAGRDEASERRGPEEEGRPAARAPCRRARVVHGAHGVHGERRALRGGWLCGADFIKGEPQIWIIIENMMTDMPRPTYLPRAHTMQSRLHA